MKSLQDAAEQAQKILEIIRDLGLEPYAPPKPLPEITPDDVHLVCWLSLVPSDPHLSSRPAVMHAVGCCRCLDPFSGIPRDESFVSTLPPCRRARGSWSDATI